MMLCWSDRAETSTTAICEVSILLLIDTQRSSPRISGKADAYVTKPFEPKVLQLTISNLVESRLQLRTQLASLNFTKESISDTTSLLDLKLMSEMKEIIEKRLGDNDFTVDVLAYELRVSRTSLYNKIKGLTGDTPSDFIRLCRINRAKELLREQHCAVSEVPELVGFTDAKHFREVFKKHVGMTPSEYAKKVKG